MELINIIHMYHACAYVHQDCNQNYTNTSTKRTPTKQTIPRITKPILHQQHNYYYTITTTTITPSLRPTLKPILE